MKKNKKLILAGIILLAIVISLPPVWSRIAYHSKEAYRTVKYWLYPPSEAVFVPSGNEGENTAVTTLPSMPTATPSLQPTADVAAAATQTMPAATVVPTPEATAEPLPPSVLLTGFKGEAQFMNNCGPATLSINLSHYDWGKDQIYAGGILKPNFEDVNVSPYELVNFVHAETELKALWRYGGTLDTLRALVSAGIPVIIEKSYEPFSLRSEGWMGHYNLVVGYDDKNASLTVQDSYMLRHTPWGEEVPPEQYDTFVGFAFSYADLEEAWRSFNNVFVVVYPPDKEDAVMQALGPLADEKSACQVALDRATQETESLDDVRGKYFAWFNAGTSQVCLEDYKAAADAYDKAFALYPDIDQARRPFRMLWYETGPYPAYYHTERYQDVIDLADQTLSRMADPVLEESYYWRGMAYNALGDTAKAIQDLRTSLRYHAGYQPSLDMLKQLGVEP